MAKQYYSVLTTYGSQQLATAIATRQPLNITHFAVGDGNGQTVTPSVSRTALVHEVHRATISAVSRDPRNNKQVIFELTIPEDVGGFHIREMGIFDSQNKLIAYANCPESFKPTLSSGSGKIQVMRMILLVESSDAVTMKVDDSVIFVTRGQLTPKKITAESQNGVDNDGHSHEIESASTTVKGIVQLTDELDLNNSTLALTAKAGKTLAERIRQAIAMSSNYIPNSKKSSAVDSNSEDTIGTSKAVKIAYDRAIEAEKKGLPVGAIVAFAKNIRPNGYLKAIGGRFNRYTYPDLYAANGNSEILPNLHRSDVGMTAYFPFDEIPDGWIAFDSIRTKVTQQNYPELYQYLVAKYGSISNVPLAEDRFIRNVANNLSVGQTQNDEIKKHVHKVRTHWVNSSDSNVFYDKTKTVIDSRLRSTSVTDDNLNDNGFMHPLLDSPMATGGAETRPRAIALILCIKAKNTFDDVQFWVKAFGVVENAGILDAGTLAQNMQELSASVEQKIEENKQSTLREINNAKADINQQFLQAQENLSQIGTLKTVWQGNVGSGRINISEKCFGKTLILYLQSSVSHRLDDNYNIEPVSFEVGAEIEDKRGGVYWLDVRRATYNIGNYTAGERFAVTVDRNGTTIQIQHLAGRFVKRIDIR
ncbi:phage tail-collar fiber domain-containing protein [Pasteurella canis]|uniref:phage tail-collar fiber domain-containing protein n=1 Tax=Pasteurella canis TaxID=753 RepID=UPI001CC1A00B|nr:phage tail protein [Pasteurella canis]UAX41249.1 phage tail protein [Pasteurella canis]